MSTPVFTLIIPTLLRHDLLFGALNSVTTRYVHRICIIDNSQLGWSVSKSWNEGIKLAFGSYGSHFAIVSNDDVIYHPDCMDGMVEAAVNGGLFLGCRHLRDPQDLTSEHTQGGFSLFLITRECIQRVGWFDEHFLWAYYEDNDYHRRMAMAGVNTDLAPRSGFFHYGSSTINHDPAYAHEMSARFVRNQQFYVKKWGGLPARETFQTPFNNPDIDFRCVDYTAP